LDCISNNRITRL